MTGFFHSLNLSTTVELGSILLVVVTAILAWYTAMLRKATVELAKDTISATKLTDRHHQESLSPLCVVRDAKCGAGSSFKNEPTLEGWCGKVEFKIQNQGVGPAVRVKAIVKPVGGALLESDAPKTYNGDALKAGELGDRVIERQVELRRMTSVDFSVRLEFENLFGSWGAMEYLVGDGGRLELVKLDRCAPVDRL